MVLYLTKDDVVKILDMKTAIKVVEDAFKEMGFGRVEMPPRLYLHFKKYNGVHISMPAYLEAIDAAGVKVVTVHPENPSKHRLPSVMATIVLNDPKTGMPMAIMDGTYITMLRTGAAGACGIKYLSRNDSEKVAIIGLGVQGRSQLLGAIEVRQIKKVKVFDIIPQVRKDYAKQMSKETGLDIEIADSVNDAVKGADIIITCTTSSQPFLKGDMIEEGTHISAIGADTRAKRELDTSTLVKANKIVVDFMDQAINVGDIAVPLQEGAIKKEDIYGELGEIIVGKKKGRTSNSEITIFKATGLAIQDIATAYKVYQLAKKEGIGKEI